MTAAEIALCLGMALSTVSAVLTRIGLGKLSRLEPPEPPNRYQRRRAGELVHIDVKKLGRIPAGGGHRVTGRGRGRHHGGGKSGWDYVHVCVDDATRLAYAELLADEQTTTVLGFMARAIAFYKRHGIRVERVMTDNGSAYRSVLHAFACRALRVRHLRTRPYRPRTNGKRSASSARCSAAGSTARSTPATQNAPTPLTAGCGTTTIAEHTAHSATSRPSPAYASSTTCLGLTPRSLITGLYTTTTEHSVVLSPNSEVILAVPRITVG
jgi:transposase InsO family protein